MKKCINACMVGVEDNKNNLHYSKSFTPSSEFDDHCIRILPGERRGWWVEHDISKNIIPQVQVRGRICNYRCTILLDSGANVSVISYKLCRILKLRIKSSTALTICGFGMSNNQSKALGTTMVKIGLNQMAYYMRVWVAEMPESMILGTDFMVSAGVRLDLYQGLAILPEEEEVDIVGIGNSPVGAAKKPPVEMDTTSDVIIDANRSKTMLFKKAIESLEVDWKLWLAPRRKMIPTFVTDNKNRIIGCKLVNHMSFAQLLPKGTNVIVALPVGQLPKTWGYTTIESAKHHEYMVNSFQSEWTLPEIVDEDVQNQPITDKKPLGFIPTRILKKGDIDSPEFLTTDNDADDEAESQPKVSVARRTIHDNQKVSNNRWLKVISNIRLKNFRQRSRAQLCELWLKQCQDQLREAGMRKPRKHVRFQLPSVHTKSTKRQAHDQRQSRRLMKLIRIQLGNNDFTHQSVPNDSNFEEKRKLFSLKKLDLDDLDQEDMGKAVYLKEGTDLTAEQLETQLAMLPNILKKVEPVDLDAIEIGEADINTNDEIKRLRDILKTHKSVFHQGGQLPPMAKGVICDIDVQGHRPINQRARNVPPQFLGKLYDLLKDLLDCKLITFSDSEWASPIVLVVKKNGIDIRLTIDYRMVNAVVPLMIYPMPLINELLHSYEACRWYCSTDAANGFWAIGLTDRARKISAFTCPLGHFEWLRMPQGFKNAPQLYQRMMDNALWGFVRPKEDQTTNTSGLDSFSIADVDGTHEFTGIRSFIDDIVIGAKTWTELCNKMDWFLGRMELWDIGISLPKSFFGKQTIEILAHKLSVDGIRTTKKLVDKVASMQFPTSLRGMQSFLGSLNFYNRFIDNFSARAACLYELKDIDFSKPLPVAEKAFTELKNQMIKAPVLRPPNSTKQFHIVLYSCKWAIGASICQEYAEKLHPVQFISRTLKDAESRYHSSEQEVLALLRALQVGYTMLAGRHIRVYSRFTTLKWLYTSKSLPNGRCLQWATMLSPWSLEVQKAHKRTTPISNLLAESMLTHEQFGQIVDTLIPERSKLVQQLPVQQWTFEDGKKFHLLSFDGAARLKEPQSAYSYIIWRYPDWKVVAAKSFYADGGTVNEAEYQGLLAGLQRATELGLDDLHVWGDSRIVLQQMQGLIQCRAQNLQPMFAAGMALYDKFKTIQFAHHKREFNGAADWLASTALEDCQGREVFLQLDHDKLRDLNKPMSNMLTGGARPVSGWSPNSHLQLSADTAKRIGNATRQYTPIDNPTGLCEERLTRIGEAQDLEPEIKQLKDYLSGQFDKLSSKIYKSCRRKADQFVLDSKNLLYYITVKQIRKTEDESLRFRLVVPRSLYHDVLHSCHSEASGGHQGVQRTFQRVRKSFYWLGMFKDVEQYVQCCLDCCTGKGAPINDGVSAGNLLPLRPGHIWALDYVIPLPESFDGNVALLVYVDAFTGYVVCDAMRSTTALDVAKSFNRNIYQRFGACDILRHDRDPRFMSEVMKEFNRLLGQQQRATLAYRPQAGGQHENKVKIVVRAVKMYVDDQHQRDWDEKMRCLMFCLNTAYDHVRQDTPFYLMHGWDPKSAIEAMIPVDQGDKKFTDAADWRRSIIRNYTYARQWALELQVTAKENRKNAHNNAIQTRTRTSKIVTGTRVWVYVPHVRKGFSKKLAHLWHGPFRVTEVARDVMCKLDVGADARFHPTVHISRVKLCHELFDRPTHVLPDDQSYDFDEALLPEDSFEPDQTAGEYEVEKILADKSVRTSAKGRYNRKFLVKWTGYDEPTWEKEQHLNCGGLLYDYFRSKKQQNRSNLLVMSDEEVEATPSL